MNNWLVKVSAYTMAIFIIFGIVFAFCAVISLPFWLFWNWLIPDIFSLPEITWLQAFGLWTFLVLLRLNNFNYNNIFNTTLKQKETDGSEKSPFSDLSWNQWFDQIKKKYEA